MKKLSDIFEEAIIMYLVFPAMIITSIICITIGVLVFLFMNKMYLTLSSIALVILILVLIRSIRKS